ncbi:bifunctional Alpha-Beta hydrolase fold/Alpha-beta hydrolase fold-1/Serine aminopeptidase [Babesia duncani]|uniref:Bifunctional Alpha-Beta hydrolase fold/Alpha-beta hydrolase fold-1/Serine aminopeptidase n=1 Tax=Babesia duncani TaxID=323732 RepID=A0AAD9PJD2_9APIC|nr:bifunctional Alpha-Beta hydrolase fold/Alpha-beta hydrolase fold-1/Serine aminopeptidase [Babesia duncani]
MDLYGHGLSAYPPYKIFGNTFSADFYVDQAEEVLNHLGLQQHPLSLIGISMGACLAAAFCKRHPTLVQRMILISPAGMIPKKPKRLCFLKTCNCCIPCVPFCICKCCIVRQLQLDKADANKQNSILQNRMLWSLFVTRNAVANILGILHRMPLWTCKGIYKHVGKLGKPTLVIFGAKDTLTPPISTRVFARLFINSHAIVFPKADHLVPFRKPTEVASTCLAFLGIPQDAKVENYIQWLPFTSKGAYIYKDQREIYTREKTCNTTSGTNTSPEEGKIVQGIGDQTDINQIHQDANGIDQDDSNQINQKDATTVPLQESPSATINSDTNASATPEHERVPLVIIAAYEQLRVTSAS